MSWVREEGIARKLHKTGKISAKEYTTLLKGCTKITGKVYSRYNMGSIIYHPNLREEVIEDIATMSLVKALKGFRVYKKAAFMSYFYNKARSYTRVQQGKLARRYHLINTVSLDDTRTTEEEGNE
jgi:hypothetical protein